MLLAENDNNSLTQMKKAGRKIYRDENAFLRFMWASMIRHETC